MSNDEQLKQKEGNWFLRSYENNFKKFLVPKVPLWLETYHLTYLTLLWSIGVLASFYFGTSNSMYLYIVPILVILQYITDVLDGAVGRHRDTGLVKWGYYADHFLDFVFMTSLVFGYAIVLGFGPWLFVLYAVMCGFMVSAFLMQGTGETFRISFLKIGPTEGRLFFIIFHTTSVYVGIYKFESLIPYAALFAGFALVVLFLSNQCTLWKKDLSVKQNNT